MRLRALIVSSLVLLSSSAFAYEFGTHGVMTYKAWLRFSFDSPDALTNLGLVDNGNAFSTDGYFDVLGQREELRFGKDFEKDLLTTLFKNNSNGLPKNEPFSVAGWLVRGAIREDDDSSSDDPSPKGDDPYGNMHRVFRHFFDPFFNAPLTTSLGDPCVIDRPAPCERAVDWAIGTSNYLQDPIQPKADRRNHFTVFDARESMYRALTGKSGDGSITSMSPETRNRYWATTFRALGDIVHLNQDMAQPQHTRNEAHSGAGPSIFQSLVTGHKSTLENFVEASVLGATQFLVGSDTPTPVQIQSTAFDFDTYTTPAFDRYSDYWARLDLKGLANYSNRGFFTAVKNLGNPSNPYPEPNRDPGTYQTEISDPVRWDGSPVAPDRNGQIGKLEFYKGSVPDQYTGVSQPGVRLSTRSVWDQFMQRQGQRRSFTLTRENYVAQANLLLPRAVGYSTGLINYFMRGRMRIAMPDEGAYAVADSSTGSGFKVIKAKVMNNTANESMSGGNLMAVVKYHRNFCYKADLTGEYGVPGVNGDQCRAGGRNDIMGSEEIAVSAPKTIDFDQGEEKTVSFDFTNSPVPVDASDLYLQVVYRGKIGNEPSAIAVGTRDISEPTYFTYHNASDYIHIAGKVYTRPQVNGDQSLLDQVFPQSCVDRSTGFPQLRPSCLQPFNLDIALSFTDLHSSEPTAKVTQMPSRRFLRFAFLTDLDAPSAPAMAKSARAARAVRINMEVRERASTSGLEKASLNQQSICLPLDPYDITPLENELDKETLNSHISLLAAIRGIYGWSITSCVINGDGSAVGSGDDRNQVMSALNPDNGETAPFQLTILDAFITPAP